MLILGIADSHDASITLVENGEVLLAVSEERFTRRKMQQGFPFEAIKYAQKFIKGRRVNKICVAGQYGRSIFRIFNGFYSKTNPQKDALSFSSRISAWLENFFADTPIIKHIDNSLSLWAIKKSLKSAKICYESIEFINHHCAHIRTAISGIDSDCYIAASLDAYGDGKSGIVIKVLNGVIIEKKEISHHDSLARFYGHICAAIGFKEGEEGKIMALADYGKKTALLGLFSSLFKIFFNNIKVNNIYRNKSFLKKIKGFKIEDVAFALQRTVENITLNFLSNFTQGINKPDLFLSGGFFANIKVTQRLNECELFNRIFVFPNMGDGGLSFCSNKLMDVYLGPGYNNEEIKDVLDSENLEYTYEPEIEGKIAVLLAEGKVIARFNGRMEYGPRALGNRSILYQTTDPKVNDWLNKKLKRSEFMPFAPVTLQEYASRCYQNIDKVKYNAKFMTISVDCTEWMKNISPAVVHVDGTARPQLIEEDDNPSYYKILKEYHRITGIPSILNTSFNMHNEPIVCSPVDALSTYRKARLDYLAIGKYLLKRL